MRYALHERFVLTVVTRQIIHSDMDDDPSTRRVFDPENCDPRTRFAGARFVFPDVTNAKSRIFRFSEADITVGKSAALSGNIVGDNRAYAHDENDSAGNFIGDV